MLCKGSRRMPKGMFIACIASFVQGGEKGMFCHEYHRWEREVEIEMCEKYGGGGVSK